MKEIIKKFEPDVTADCDIEIRAFSLADDKAPRNIQWRLKLPPEYAADAIHYEGIWPFRRKIINRIENPWRPIKIMDEDGEEDYLHVGGYNTAKELDMYQFIQLRSRLKRYGDLLNLIEEIRERNIKRWCDKHQVPEFIEINDNELQDMITWK